MIKKERFFSYNKLRHLFKLTRAISAVFILTLSLLAITPSARAEPTYYVVDIQAKTCNPHHYESMDFALTGVVLSRDATELSIYCPIPTLEGAVANNMEVIYLDHDGESESSGISVFLVCSPDDQRRNSTIATFNSNDRESPEDVHKLVKERTRFSHTFNFFDNSYYIRAVLRRRNIEEPTPLIRTIRLLETLE